MHQKYKGTPTPLSQIPSGTVVELINPALVSQRYLTPALTNHPVKDAITGVLVTIVPSHRGANGILRIYNGQGKPMSSASIVRPSYNSFPAAQGVDAGNPNLTDKELAFSVMTGTRVREVSAAWRADILASTGLRHNLAITSGCDPEMFVTGGGGDMIPAFTFLPSKAKRATDQAPYWDGFQAEFDPKARACCEELCTHIQRGMSYLLSAAKSVDSDASLSLSGVMDVPPEFFSTAKPEYLALGCSPSLNVYNAKAEFVARPEDLPFRFAGGHMHFGVGAHVKAHAPRIVKALDRVLGIATVAMFQSIDNPVRRQFYGMAGEYRLPPHGIEYRVLSPAWLVNPTVYFLLFDLARCVISAEMGNFLGGFLAPISEEEVQRIINTCDAGAAGKYCEENEEFFRAFLKSYYQDTGALYSAFMDLIISGVESHFKTSPDAVAKSWSLTSLDTFRRIEHEVKNWKPRREKQGAGA